MIGNELVFSQPGGCIMYNIEEETFTKYTVGQAINTLSYSTLSDGRFIPRIHGQVSNGREWIIGNNQ